MDKKKLKEFEKKLLQKHSDLASGKARAKQAGFGEGDEGSEDSVDYAVKSYTKEFLLSLSDMERRVLHLVEESLARLRRGEYGDCQECGKPISEKRLQAIPWTPLCIQCQELQENQPQAAGTSRTASGD